MSRWGKVWTAAVVALALYFGLAEGLRRSFVNPAPEGHIVVRLNRPFEKHGEFGVTSYQLRSIQSFQNATDSVDRKKRSPVLLYENNRLLGPGHSSLDQVAQLGRGRYLHSSLGFVFSASDNTDPNVNGRRYWAVLP